MNLRWPVSVSQVESIQREQARGGRACAAVAVPQEAHPQGAGRGDLAPHPGPHQGRAALDPPERFHDEFCIQPRTKAVEYWRSGGATGRPLFYPRSAEDMQHGLLAFERAWALIGATPTTAPISFPLGVHPVAHLYARAAINRGIGTVWCGAGAIHRPKSSSSSSTTSSPIPLGMASYGLHLANLAEAKLRLGFHGEEDHRGGQARSPR